MPEAETNSVHVKIMCISTHLVNTEKQGENLWDENIFRNVSYTQSD